MTEQLGLFGGDGEGRDVVQRRFQRQDRPVSARALAISSRMSSEIGLLEAERAGAGASQIGDMADRSKRMGDVAGEAADVGAFGDGGDERVTLVAPSRSSDAIEARGWSPSAAFISTSSPARARA